MNSKKTNVFFGIFWNGYNPLSLWTRIFFIVIPPHRNFKVFVPSARQCYTADKAPPAAVCINASTAVSIHREIVNMFIGIVQPT